MSVYPRPGDNYIYQPDGFTLFSHHNDTMEEANLANGNFLYSMLFYTIINSKYTAVYLIKECYTTG